MSDGDSKRLKKEAKARAKVEKARVKADVERAKADAEVAAARASAALPARVPEGVGVSVRKLESGSELVVSGLRDEQLERILPEISKEVLIAVTAERSAFRAGLMRFVREGIFQTIVKLVAGLIVGYLLIRFGMR